MFKLLLMVASGGLLLAATGCGQPARRKPLTTAYPPSTSELPNVERDRKVVTEADISVRGGRPPTVRLIAPTSQPTLTAEEQAKLGPPEKKFNFLEFYQPQGWQVYPFPSGVWTGQWGMGGPATSSGGLVWQAYGAFGVGGVATGSPALVNQPTAAGAPLDRTPGGQQGPPNTVQVGTGQASHIAGRR
jgi:hypothetical protein